MRLTSISAPSIAESVRLSRKALLFPVGLGGLPGKPRRQRLADIVSSERADPGQKDRNRLTAVKRLELSQSPGLDEFPAVFFRSKKADHRNAGDAFPGLQRHQARLPGVLQVDKGNLRISDRFP
ncbi:hypothetical protein QW131_16830 [Roseibium salinum]|nr:hypothetical protein [Roseibium salinum]